MHWSGYNRPAEHFEHQNNLWTVAMMRKLGMVSEAQTRLVIMLSDRDVPDVPVAHHASSL
jgi:hypothetical protein